MKPIPERPYLEECFIYQDGELYWKVRPPHHFSSKRTTNMWNAKFAGSRAGRQMSGREYRQVGLDGARYLEHRLVAALHGMRTDLYVDHIDRNGMNNRIENLRPATQTENMRNNGGWKKKPLRHGIHKKANGRYTAHIRTADGHKHLGTFATEAEAIHARTEAEADIYGEFAPDLRMSA